MRILVCGSRTWTNRKLIEQFFDVLRPDVIYEGESFGADVMARDAAESRGIMVHSYPANWRVNGNSAGPIRNRAMFKDAMRMGLHLVLAFSNDIIHSRGTVDMIRVAQGGGIPVMLMSEGENDTAVVSFPVSGKKVARNLL